MTEYSSIFNEFGISLDFSSITRSSNSFSKDSQIESISELKQVSSLVKH